jgi:hypothetical protein
MKKILLKIIYVVVAVFLSGCGGSGSCTVAGMAFGKAMGDACASNEKASESGQPSYYIAVANIGELVEWEIDWNSSPPRYAYNIIESAYNLEGEKNSGTLQINGDGTYKPSNIPGGVIVRAANGSIAAQIYIKKPGSSSSILVDVVGIPSRDGVQINPLMDNIYNYIGSKCTSGVCNATYGTIKFSLDRWELCPVVNSSNVNITSTPQCMDGLVGTYRQINQSEVHELMDVNGLQAGKLLAPGNSSSAKNTLIVDFNGKSPLIGVGSIYAARQVGINSDLLEGVWQYRNSSDIIYKSLVSKQRSDSYALTSSGCSYDVDPKLANFSNRINQPWNGFLKNDYGDVVLVSDSSLFAAYSSGSVLPVIGVRTGDSITVTPQACVPGDFRGVWNGTFNNAGRIDPAIFSIGSNGEIWGVSSYYGSIPSALLNGTALADEANIYLSANAVDFTRGSESGKINVNASKSQNSSSLIVGLEGVTSVFSSVANQLSIDESSLSGKYAMQSGSIVPGLASLSLDATITKNRLKLNFGGGGGCIGDGLLSSSKYNSGIFDVEVKFSKSGICSLSEDQTHRGILLVNSGGASKKLHLFLKNSSGLPSFAAIGNRTTD